MKSPATDIGVALTADAYFFPFDPPCISEVAVDVGLRENTVRSSAENSRAEV